MVHLDECAKFRGSRAIVCLMGPVSPCHRALMGSKIFLVGISWVQNIFSWVFCGSQTFSRGYFVDPRFYDFQ